MIVLILSALLLVTAGAIFAGWREWRYRKQSLIRDARRRKRYHDGAAYQSISRWLFAHRRNKRLTHQPHREEPTSRKSERAKRD